MNIGNFCFYLDFFQKLLFMSLKTFVIVPVNFLRIKYGSAWDQSNFLESLSFESPFEGKVQIDNSNSLL